MKIIGDFEFYRNWCLSVKEMLAHFENNLGDVMDHTSHPESPEEYFNVMAACIEEFFENVLHEIVDVDYAAVNVFITEEDAAVILDNYGDDDILTNQKIGEYALFELANTVLESETVRFEKERTAV